MAKFSDKVDIDRKVKKGILPDYKPEKEEDPIKKKIGDTPPGGKKPEKK